MKKFACMLLVLVLMSVIIPMSAFALSPANVLPDIVPAIDPGSKSVLLIEDHSWSMENSFVHTSGILFEKVAKLEWAEEIEFGNNSKTPLWEVLNSQIDEYEMIFVVSDLWDTGTEELSEASNKELALLVPYYSTNSAAVKHVEDVINNIILKKWSDSTVHVLYVDGSQYEFSNVAK